MLGNTGIGKTVSLNYFLRRVLQRGYRVLFETREMRYFFHDGTVEWEMLSQKELETFRYYRSVLLLVDHQQGQPPPFCDAFIVAPVAPDAVTCSEWHKNRCFRLWMPLTTCAEVMAMNQIEPRLDEGLLREWMAECGPIPRHLFEKDRKSAERLVSSKIAAFDFAKCRTLGLLQSGELPDTWDVLHVTTKDLRSPSRVNWASPWVNKCWREDIKAISLWIWST